MRQVAVGVVGEKDRRVSTGTALADAAHDQISADAQDLRLTLLPFAAVALLVGMFVIANTFTILVTQRARQFALLRAAGDIVFTVSPVAVLLGYGIAVLVTVLAAYGSARRAAAIPPMTALRMDATVSREVRLRRSVVALCLVAVGVLMLAPVLADYLLRPLEALVRRRGPASRLGVRNAARDSRRGPARVPIWCWPTRLTPAAATVPTCASTGSRRASIVPARTALIRSRTVVTSTRLRSPDRAGLVPFRVPDLKPSARAKRHLIGE